MQTKPVQPKMRTTEQKLQNMKKQTKRNHILSKGVQKYKKTSKKTIKRIKNIKHWAPGACGILLQQW